MEFASLGGGGVGERQGPGAMHDPIEKGVISCSARACDSDENISTPATIFRCFRHALLAQNSRHLRITLSTPFFFGPL